MSTSVPLLLGIDTGGTYTDAVLYREDAGVLAKAKALTTRHDLAIGIGEAVEAVIARAGVAASAIRLVCLSTTLATNALVEGQGGRAALVMIGFSERELARDGLADALGGDPVIFLPGGHDVHGSETLLDTSLLRERLPALADTVSAVAVAGYFAVRNPDHEIRVRDMVRETTGLPVTCSHELSSRLGGPRRALTTLLNARLVPMIDRLVGACGRFLEARGIDAPMMVVRGDGALISAAEAGRRPIETILSGPAASLVGARHLTGLADAVVSDIGGTTTDVAVVEGGRPRLDGEGAVVGGHRTMVEAVAMRTFGLGGDSEVHLDDRALLPALTLGPRRLVPLSLAAMASPGVLDALERQLRGPQPGRLDGRFAFRAGLPGSMATGLSPQEQALYEKLTQRPEPLADLLAGTAQRATLDRLVARGLAQIAGLTPSDALHVLSRQDQWNGEAARLGCALMARRRDGAGRPVAESAEALAEAIVARLTRQSAEAVLTACLAEDGASEIVPSRSEPVARALAPAGGIVRFALSLDRPLVGLGASAPVCYPPVAVMLGAKGVVPADADVANAIGAVVGQVRMTVSVLVTSPEEGLFVVGGVAGAERFTDEAAAMAFARDLASGTARERAAANGAGEVVLDLAEVVEAPIAEGSRKFIEARLTATASGRPRIARS